MVKVHVAVAAETPAEHCLLAVEHLVLQAEVRGLHVLQLSGTDDDAAADLTSIVSSADPPVEAAELEE